MNKKYINEVREEITNLPQADKEIRRLLGELEDLNKKQFISSEERSLMNALNIIWEAYKKSLNEYKELYEEYSKLNKKKELNKQPLKEVKLGGSL